jgi:hypothetical protein
VSKTDPEQERLVKRLRENAGPRVTPNCPDDAAHGPLWRWSFSGHEWLCSHEGHLGNPKGFTDEEVRA